MGILLLALVGLSSIVMADSSTEANPKSLKKKGTKLIDLFYILSMLPRTVYITASAFSLLVFLFRAFTVSNEAFANETNQMKKPDHKLAFRIQLLKAMLTQTPAGALLEQHHIKWIAWILILFNLALALVFVQRNAWSEDNGQQSITNLVKTTVVKSKSNQNTKRQQKSKRKQRKKQRKSFDKITNK